MVNITEAQTIREMQTTEGHRVELVKYYDLMHSKGYLDLAKDEEGSYFLMAADDVSVQFEDLLSAFYGLLAKLGRFEGDVDIIHNGEDRVLVSPELREALRVAEFPEPASFKKPVPFEPPIGVRRLNTSPSTVGLQVAPQPAEVKVTPAITNIKPLTPPPRSIPQRSFEVGELPGEFKEAIAKKQQQPGDAVSRVQQWTRPDESEGVEAGDKGQSR